MLFLRSASFENALSSDKSANYLTGNQRQKGGRREAEGRQNGLTTEARPIQSLAAPSCFCKFFCFWTLCCKGSGCMVWNECWKRPIWRIAENCGILRSARMLFAKSRWQRSARMLVSVLVVQRDWNLCRRPCLASVSCHVYAAGQVNEKVWAWHHRHVHTCVWKARSENGGFRGPCVSLL